MASTLQVDTIKNAAGTGSPNFPNGLTSTGVTDGSSPTSTNVGAYTENVIGNTNLLTGGATGASGIVNGGSFSLPAGDWLIWVAPTVGCTGSAVVTQMRVGLSTANNSYSLDPKGLVAIDASITLTTINCTLSLTPVRINVSTPTTYFFNASVNATSNSATVRFSGTISMVRLR